MSLRETLDAARQEAQDAGSIFAGKEKDEDGDGRAEPEPAPRRFRGSAAHAKPVRDAASSVRVVSADSTKRSSRSGKPRSEMTKEERKAEKDATRRAQDKQAAARNALLNSWPEYKRSQRVWWILLGTGLGFTVVAFIVNWLMTDTLSKQQGVTPMVVAAIAPLVIAYACIIIAVIYDLRVGRPLRKRADAEIQGMSTKRMNALIREEEQREEEKRAAKRAKKEARGK